MDKLVRKVESAPSKRNRKAWEKVDKRPSAQIRRITRKPSDEEDSDDDDEFHSILALSRDQLYGGCAIEDDLSLESNGSDGESDFSSARQHKIWERHDQSLFIEDVDDNTLAFNLASGNFATSTRADSLNKLSSFLAKPQRSLTSQLSRCVVKFLGEGRRATVFGIVVRDGTKKAAGQLVGCVASKSVYLASVKDVGNFGLDELPPRYFNVKNELEEANNWRSAILEVEINKMLTDVLLGARNRRLTCPGVVALVGYEFTRSPLVPRDTCHCGRVAESRLCLHMVFEMARGGSLRKLLDGFKDSDDVSAEKWLVSVNRQVLIALYKCSALGVSHNAVSLDTIMALGGGGGVSKEADFWYSFNKSKLRIKQGNGIPLLALCGFGMASLDFLGRRSEESVGRKESLAHQLLLRRRSCRSHN